MISPVDRLEWPFCFRCGIHTGRVLVGNMGFHSRMKYGIVGHLVVFFPRRWGKRSHHGLVCLKIGVPNRWMVYFMEIPKVKWMITGGTPILGNLHIRVYLKPGWFVGCNHKVMICWVNGSNRRSQGFVNLQPTLQNQLPGQLNAAHLTSGCRSPTCLNFTGHIIIEPSNFEGRLFSYPSIQL